MNLEAKISLFRDHFDTDPVADLTIKQFCDYVRESNEYATTIQAIRNPTISPEKRRKLKSTLPGVTVSGAFSKREAKGLTQHSGFVVIDIDGKHNPDVTDWPGLRDRMMDIGNVAFSALSCSGKGVFILIPIAYPDQHLLQLRQLFIDFESAAKVKPDTSCTDVSRFRYISIDPEAKINPDAIPYTKIYHSVQPPARHVEYDEQELMQLLKLIIQSGIDITTDYKDWFAIGCALANELGEAGRSYFSELSRFYEGYDYQETKRQYTRCMKYGGNFTKNTIFYIADQHGINLKRMRR